MNLANLTIKRPELCKACQRNKPCPREEVFGVSACNVYRRFYDAGYATALTKLQQTLDGLRSRQQPRAQAEPGTRRRRRTKAKPALERDEASNGGLVQG